MNDMSRRRFIRSIGAAGLGMAASPLRAATTQSGKVDAGQAGPLPARGEFVIEDAYLMTMDPDLGDIPKGSVLVRNGEIIAVGDVQAGPRTLRIDGRGMIVMPGIVETHWHMWNTLFRSFSGDKAADGYFPTVARYGALMTPADMYQGTRLAAAEAINSGMTTVHDWCHNVRSREHAELDIQALRDVGIRARWSYGWWQNQTNTEIINLADLRGLHRDWAGFSNDGLLTMGLGWRGKYFGPPIPEKIYRAELDTARELGLPISIHIGSRRSQTGQIEAHIKEKLFGKDVQLVHALSASDAEIRMVHEAGASVSVSPGSEMPMGYGLCRAADFHDAGVPVGVSLDTAALTGNANLFNVLKLVRDIENTRAESEFKMSARRALEFGTIEGARSMGLDALVGSLVPGKRADIIMISPRALNMGVMTDPAHLVLESTTPENVDTVIVDGRILKRAGRLTALSPDIVVKGASETLERLRKQAAWR